MRMTAKSRFLNSCCKLRGSWVGSGTERTKAERFVAGWTGEVNLVLAGGCGVGVTTGGGGSGGCGFRATIRGAVGEVAGDTLGDGEGLRGEGEGVGVRAAVPTPGGVVIGVTGDGEGVGAGGVKVGDVTGDGVEVGD